MYMYVYVYIYIYIHTYVHTYVYISLRSPRRWAARRLVLLPLITITNDTDNTTINHNYYY